MASCAAWVDTVTMESELSHQQHAMLHYKIQYPQFSGTYFQRMLNELNCIYKAKAQAVQQGRVRELFCLATGEIAAAQKQEDDKRQIPRYDLDVSFQTTFNQSCVLSLYFDQYEFTGGAHGNTVRCSETWNLQRGCCMLLRDLFVRPINCKTYIVEQVNKQIAEQMEAGNDIYFDDYACLTNRYFNERNFYLSPEGVVVYYQQYEIAPYVVGIPTFTIPYSQGCVIKPGGSTR